MFNKKALKKFFIYFSVSIFISLVVSFIYLFYHTLPETINGTLQDYMFKIRGEKKQNNNIVIVDIDEKSLGILGQWPWSRDDVSKILENLTLANVGVIGMDIVFAEKDRSSPHKIFQDFNRSIEGIPNYDKEFGQMVANTPTILGYQFILDEEKYVNTEPPFIQAIIIEKNKHQDIEYIFSAKGAILNIPEIQENGYSSGFFNNIPDPSGMVRAVPLVIKYDNQMYPSLALELIRISLGVRKIVVNYGVQGVDNIFLGGITIPTDRYGRLIINYRGKGKTFKYISAVDIFTNNFKVEDIEGKIVLIGTSATGLLDLRATPFDAVFPGVEVHANAIDNIIEGDFISKSADLDGINLVIIFIVSIITVFLVSYSPLWLNPFIMILMSSFISGLFYYSLFYQGIILELFLPLLSVIISTLIATFMNYFFEIKKEQLIKKKFASKVSLDVMENLLSSADDAKFQAMEREVTVFFSDVRGFTNISEAMPDAKTLIDFMNEYMDPMTDIIMKQKGTVDKYIGDAIMAYWNAPLSVENHAELAVIATMEQLHALDNLNKIIKKDKRYIDVVKMSKENGVEPLDIGIGINTGKAIVGEMGSSVRSDYTVIGDAINLGARLESLCKYYNSKCNISNFTKAQLTGDYIYRFLDLVTVKGKKEPIEIWQIHDYDRAENLHKLYDVSKKQLKYELELYHNAVDIYKKGDFKKALDLFTDINGWDNKTNSKIYLIYMERCSKYLLDPPLNFNGVYAHTTKG